MNNQKMSNFPIIVFIISTIIGVGIITLPREAANVIDQPNMWISLILGASIAFLNGLLIFAMIKRYPSQTIYEIAPKIAGRWIGSVFNLIFVVYCIAISAYIVRTMAEIVNYYLLDLTPRLVVITVLIIACFYLVSAGIENIMAFLQLYFPLILLMFFVLTVLSIRNIDITNLRPIFIQDIGPLLKGAKITFFSFVGYELIMVLSKKGAIRNWKSMSTVLLLSLGAVCTIYVLFFILNIGILSVEELKVTTFPTIEMAKSIEFQGFFFERFELLFLFGWIITIFTTVVAYYYAALLGLCTTLNCKKKWYLNGVVGISIILFAMYPDGITELFSYGTYINYLSYASLIAIPLILLLITVSRRSLR
ncbi:GerAB/ArcD/ProY family transporter [Guptibacillus algicola]|uniref:GerAB/ArcD/ProY family transporter n=1 Tax=Guptibacillus algicola TaxID=225844 RepID=UPI001CD45CAD|nr:endospore germination permease [Alkalihalobacillus algicola]MCA0987414.1 spore germination protein [Alkalihalobacillus algicola]